MEKTYDEWMSAVQLDGDVLGQVPEALRTAGLCAMAVQQNGNVLKYMSDLAEPKSF